MTYFRTLVALVSVAALARNAGAQPKPDDGVVKEQLLGAWRSAIGLVKTSSVTETLESQRASDGESLRATRVDVVRRVVSGDSWLFEYAEHKLTERQRLQVDGSCTVVNGQYKATMSRPKADSKYSLIEYQRLSAPDATERGAKILPWTIVGNNVMWEWLPDPRVRVVRTENPADGVLRVHFGFSAAAGKPGGPTDNPFGVGWIDFEPGSAHRVLGYRMDRKSKFSDWTETGVFEYVSAGPLPILNKVVVDVPDMRSEKFGRRKSRETFTYEIEYNKNVPAEIFWLSHYGLPEPAGVTPPRSTPRYVWFLVAAVVFGLVALLLRLFARRRVTTPAAPA